MKEDRHFFLSKDNSCWNSKFWWLKVRQSLIHSGAKPIRNCRHGKESDAEERQKKKVQERACILDEEREKRGIYPGPFQRDMSWHLFPHLYWTPEVLCHKETAFDFLYFCPQREYALLLKRKVSILWLLVARLCTFVFFFFNKIQSRDRDPTHRNWRKLYGTYSVKLN